MIYIFDDRRQRRSDNEEKLSQFSDVVKFVQLKLTPGKSVEESLIDSLNSPECIMFHKSYVFTEKEVSYETVRETLGSYEVPVIIFSGGTEFSNKGTTQTDINAEVMYQNLPLFIRDYKEKGKINIDVLLWGEKHRLNALLEIQNEIAKKYYIEMDLEEIIQDTDKIKIERDLNKLCPKVDRSLGENIIDEIAKTDSLTWGELMDIVDNNIKKFK